MSSIAVAVSRDNSREDSEVRLVIDDIDVQGFSRRLKPAFSAKLDAQTLLDAQARTSRLTESSHDSGHAEWSATGSNPRLVNLLGR